jgi:nicotinamidase-related amidase
MTSALIIIDIQNDYFSGGNMALVGIEQAAANANCLLESFRSKQAPIFHIRHLAMRKNTTFFIPDTVGAEIHATVKPQEGEPIVIKHYPNSFHQTDLHKMLQGNQIEKLIICGAMSHMCVDSTTRAAYDLGYACTVIADACATKDLYFDNKLISAQQVHMAFMGSLQGVFADVISLAQYQTHRQGSNDSHQIEKSSFYPTRYFHGYSSHRILS